MSTNTSNHAPHGNIVQKNPFIELSGAAFLMATSAIGPGFLTQTALFTSRFGADFASAILLSTVLDIIVQLTIWRVIIAANKPASAIADSVFKGSGSILTIAIVLGGIVFNVGNIGGTGLGSASALGMDVQKGAMISALMAAGIFLFRRAMTMMDIFARSMGAIMIGIAFYVAWSITPPLLLAMKSTVFPQSFDISSTLTLVGGTVGGYISFAGGHRLLEEFRGTGQIGLSAIQRVSVSAYMGIGIAALMRILLFLAALGVVSHGGILPEQNPAVAVFTLSLGDIGTRLFGVVIWAASITSVIGSAYTSVSFIIGIIPQLENWRNSLVVGFILISAFIFFVLGNPVTILVAAGRINSFVIPFALAIMLLATRKKAIIGEYQHPTWLMLSGIVVTLLLLSMSLYSILK